MSAYTDPMKLAWPVVSFAAVAVRAAPTRASALWIWESFATVVKILGFLSLPQTPPLQALDALLLVHEIRDAKSVAHSVHEKQVVMLAVVSEAEDAAAAAA